jgi:hypothetical protein
MIGAKKNAASGEDGLGVLKGLDGGSQCLQSLAARVTEPLECARWGSGGVVAANDDIVTVQCAWCGTILKQGGETISHGICRDCAPVLLERIRERLGKKESPAPDTKASELRRAAGD